jgi:lipoprotein-anchoring transpeptidase ErfK/SrfK
MSNDAGKWAQFCMSPDNWADKTGGHCLAWYQQLHYAIHGSSQPQNVGRTESHDCIRLTHWDAGHLSLMVTPGTSLYSSCEPHRSPGWAATIAA